MTQNKYCETQDSCKLLKSANQDYEKIANQYNKVVEQNQGLQGELRKLQEKFDEREHDLLIIEELNTCLQLKVRELETDGLTLVKQNDILRENLKCKYLVLDECSLTGKNCIGFKTCIEKHQEILEGVRNIILGTLDNGNYVGSGQDDFEQALQKINEVQR